MENNPMPSSKTKNVLKRGLVLGFVLLIGVVGYFLMSGCRKNLPNASPGEVVSSVGGETKDWAVYQNKEYGFEMRYPGTDLSLVENGKDGLVMKSFADADVEGSKVSRLQIMVGKVVGSALDEAKREVEYGPVYAEAPEIEGPAIKQVNGETIFVTTTRRFDEGDNYGFSRKYYFPDYFAIFSYASHQEDGGMGDIEQKILSTLTSIEKEQSGIKMGKGELDRGVDVALLQKQVDEGDQSWRAKLAGGCHGACDDYEKDLNNGAPIPVRLKPETVLQQMGISFGFSNEDLKNFKEAKLNPDYEYVRSTDKRVFRVSHNNEIYLITLTQPVAGFGKVWIISAVEKYSTVCNPKLYGIKFESGVYPIFKEANEKWEHVAGEEFRQKGYSFYCVDWQDIQTISSDFLDKVPENEIAKELESGSSSNNIYDDWFGYNDSEKRIAFEYPKEWSYRDWGKNGKSIVFCKDSGADKSTCAMANLNVKVDIFNRSGQWDIKSVSSLTVDRQKALLTVSERTQGIGVQSQNGVRTMVAYLVKVRTLGHDVYFEYVFTHDPGSGDEQQVIQKHLDTFKNILASVKLVKEMDTIGWQEYGNKEASFTFKYPKGWEIFRDQFYATAAEVKASKRTVEIRKVGENEEANPNDWIGINIPQFDCMKGRCWGDMGTYSTDPEVLNIFDGMVATLKPVDK